MMEQGIEIVGRKIWKEKNFVYLEKDKNKDEEPISKTR